MKPGRFLTEEQQGSGSQLKQKNKGGNNNNRRPVEENSEHGAGSGMGGKNENEMEEIASKFGIFEIEKKHHHHDYKRGKSNKTKQKNEEGTFESDFKKNPIRMASKDDDNDLYKDEESNRNENNLKRVEPNHHHHDDDDDEIQVVSLKKGGFLTESTKRFHASPDHRNESNDNDDYFKNEVSDKRPNKKEGLRMADNHHQDYEDRNDAGWKGAGESNIRSDKGRKKTEQHHDHEDDDDGKGRKLNKLKINVEHDESGGLGKAFIPCFLFFPFISFSQMKKTHVNLLFMMMNFLFGQYFQRAEEPFVWRWSSTTPSS